MSDRVQIQSGYANADPQQHQGWQYVPQIQLPTESGGAGSLFTMSGAGLIAMIVVAFVLYSNIKRGDFLGAVKWGVGGVILLWVMSFF